MNSMTEIKNTLRAARGSDALFSMVSTRVMLKTGVDLSKAEAVRDPNAVPRVLEALAAMGYSAGALKVIAQRRK